MIQHMQHHTQHDMQHSNPHTTHPQGLGWGGGVGPLGMGGVGVRMLHIMLCIMLHVLDLLLRCRDKDFGLINFLPDKKKHPGVFGKCLWGPSQKLSCGFCMTQVALQS